MEKLIFTYNKTCCKALLLVLLLAASCAFASDGYLSGIFCRIYMMAIAAIGLDICVGLTGQLSLCHGAFMGVGAYCAALCAKSGWGAVIGILLGMAMAAAVAGVTGSFVLGLKGDYLAVATLGLGEIFRSLFENLPITGGAKGLYNIPVTTSLLLCAILFVGVLAGAVLLRRSRLGSYSAAVACDETAAVSCGINTHAIKVGAFSFSAAVTALAGGLYAGLLGFISPADFTFQRSVDLLAAVVLGGPGTLVGPSIAAGCIETVNALFQPLAQLRMILYGFALVGVVLLRYGRRRGRRKAHGTDRA